MKKIILLFIGILLIGKSINAQTIPQVAIKDIQFIHPDSLMVAPHDYKSPYEGDTVIVTGVVTVAPRYGASPDSNKIMRTGATEQLLLVDPNNPDYSGIIVRFIGSDASDFMILDTGMVIKVKGVVNEYNITTQFNVTEFTGADVIGITERPKPILITLDSLAVTGTNTPNYLAEKWEGMYVEVRNVTTSDPGALGGGSFMIFDDNGTQAHVGRASTWINSSQPPLAGTKLEYVRGYVESRNNISNGWFIINPCYRDDIKLGNIIPPRITNVTRNKAYVGFNESMTINAKIKDPDGTVTSAKIYYKTETGQFQTIDMTATQGDSIYSGTIPGQSSESLIAYYIEAKDNSNAVSTNPANYTNNLYFYQALNRPLTIKDVQYSPFGGGYSGYNGFEVTLTGTVTADTTDLEGDGGTQGPQVFMQSGKGAWTGIRLYGTETLKLRRGDNVTVKGIVNENYNITEIKSLDLPANVVVNSTGNPLPEPLVLQTSTIGVSTNGSLPAESYEGVLVKYENLTITDDNADGESGPVTNNYGEIYVADASNVQTRVELQEGTHSFHNSWNGITSANSIKVKAGDTFESLTGILSFSFSNYKLFPRKNDDFVGFVNDVEEETEIPNTYVVNQNYPNPFNPSTTIEFSIPEASYVSLRVYNSIGQEVTTLVNGYLNRGLHKFNFNASKLSSGVYFYRIESGNFNTVKKMVLMK